MTDTTTDTAAPGAFRDAETLSIPATSNPAPRRQRGTSRTARSRVAKAGTRRAAGARHAKQAADQEGRPSFAEFFAGYVSCALWSSTDDEGNPLDDNFGAEDIGDDTDKAMREDCADFMRANAADLAAMMEATGRDMSSMGHDFWLTRNGLGAGRGLRCVGAHARGGQAPAHPLARAGRDRRAICGADLVGGLHRRPASDARHRPRFH